MARSKNPNVRADLPEPRAGQRTLTLARPVSGWQPGDRVFLPDTRQVPDDNWFDAAYPLQIEERTIPSMSRRWKDGDALAP